MMLVQSVLFFSCKESPKVQSGLYFKNNIESSLGWYTDATIFKTKDAHSGEYVSKIDSVTIYSLGFNLPLSIVNERFLPVTEVKASVWAMFKSRSAKGALITELKKNDSLITWQSVRLQQYCLEANKWYKVEYILNLKDNDFNNSENLFRFYVANDSKEEIYLDDFEVEFLN